MKIKIVKSISTTLYYNTDKNCNNASEDCCEIKVPLTI